MPSRSSSDLRAINRGVVLKTVARTASHGNSVSRQYLAEQSGLTTAAISRITRQLIDARILQESSTVIDTNGPGRKTRELELTDNGAYLIAMVISANTRSVAVANSKGQVLASKDLNSLSLVPAQKAVSAFCTSARSLLKKLKIPASRVIGVSVVLAVNTNPANHNKVSSEVIGWKEVELKNVIMKNLSLPVHLEARSVALLQTELWNDASLHSNSVFLVNNGWRLGSCVFVEDKLLETDNGRLGQIAHLVVNDHLSQCYCGYKGCLDAVCSGEAIVNAIIHAGILDIPTDIEAHQKLSMIIDAATTDATVAKVLYRAGEHLGSILKNVQTLYFVERVLLAGAIARQPDFVAGVRQKFQAYGNCKIIICNVNSLEAAIRSGLNEFLFSESFNLQQLEQAPLSA